MVDKYDVQVHWGPSRSTTVGVVDALLSCCKAAGTAERGKMVKVDAVLGLDRV